jgi:alanine dehydrogenase
MRIGCVKEIKNYEFRVGLTPDNVKSYTNAGHMVLIESVLASAVLTPMNNMSLRGLKLLPMQKQFGRGRKCS